MKIRRGKADIWKECSRCHVCAFEFKDILDKFAKDSKRPDRLDYYCKKCRNALQKARRQWAKKRQSDEPSAVQSLWD